MSDYPQTINDCTELRSNRFVLAFAEGYADGLSDGVEQSNYFDDGEELRRAYLDGFNHGVAVYCGTIDEVVERVRDYQDNDKDWYEKNIWLKAQGNVTIEGE